ncbi:MAG TPA: hypothetical protein VEB68_11110 [Croceibacterium sp.]|nr:hypothetical protein [Croceibacterium sp.]
MARTPPTRSFRSRPGWKEVVLSVFFIPLAAILWVDVVVDSGREGLPVALATTAMAGLGLLVVWRRRLPWHGPALVADAEGAWFWPERPRRLFMPWADVASVGWDPSDRSLVFHPVVPGTYDQRHLIWLRRPPAVPSDIRTEDGTYFGAVLEDYLPPKRGAPKP